MTFRRWCVISPQTIAGERHDSPRILGRSHAASCAAPLSGQYPRTAQCGGACHDYGADGGSGVEDIDRQCENMHDEAPQVPLSSLEDIESHAVRQAIRASGGICRKRHCHWV